MRTIATILLAVSVLCGPIDSDAASYSRPREQTIRTDTRSVFDTIARFVHGVRVGSTEIVASAWTLPALPQSAQDDGRSNQLFSEVGELQISDGQPALVLVKPRIEWTSGGAVVHCFAVWDLRFRDGTRFSWNGAERIELSSRGGKYSITNADVSLLILQYARKPKELKARLDKKLVPQD